MLLTVALAPILLNAAVSAAASSTAPHARAASYISYPRTNLTALLTGPPNTKVTVRLYGALPPMAGSCEPSTKPSSGFGVSYSGHGLAHWTVRLGAGGHATLHIGKRSATGCYAWSAQVRHGPISAFSAFLLTLPGTIVT